MEDTASGVRIFFLRFESFACTWFTCIYIYVVLAKLLYASSSWVDFTNATDRQKLQAFLNRSKRSVFFFDSELDDFTSNKQLFNRILNRPVRTRAFAAS